MGLITRCPNCGTLFKVVPDQLRISEGWVRCGHCAQVFDASASLQSASAQSGAEWLPDADSVPLAPPVPGSGPDATREPEPAPAPRPDRPGPPATSEPPESTLESQLDDSVSLPEPDSEQLDAQAQALVEDPLDRPFELRRQDLGADDDAVLDEPRAPAAAAEPPLEDLAFVRQARRQAGFSRPPMRITFTLLLIVLGLLLAVQVAVHDRDRLAVSEPALRPWLARLCLALDCSIQAPRRIEQIAIDSSSFNKLRADTYRLQVTLKNQGQVDVAMPSLELTLTDSQDQAVVRRVLLPRELGASRAALASATEWSGSVAFAVPDNSIGSRIAGYRLLAFYP